MQVIDKELDDLIAQGKATGYLTFDAVNAYLPDEDVSPEKLESLLLAIESRGIELIDAPTPKRGSPSPAKRAAPSRSAVSTAKVFQMPRQPVPPTTKRCTVIMTIHPT